MNEKTLYCWPVATPDDLDSRFTSPILPYPWTTLHNQYLHRYSLGYHTGIDPLIVGTADQGAPIYAIGNGQVVGVKHITRTRKGAQSSWGMVVVISHPDEHWSRYAHVESDRVLVRVGDQVKRGQHIAYCGNADGYYHQSGYHLHLDVLVTDAAERDPGHWPGLNRAEVLRHYIDPIKFIQANRGEAKVENTLVVIQPVRLRWYPGTLTPVRIQAIPAGARVELLGESVQIGGYEWVAVRFGGKIGWCAKRTINNSVIYLAA